MHPIRGRQALPWVAACSLLLSEYLFTTFAINMQALAERGDWLAELRSAGTPGPILLAMVTAALLVGGRPMLSEFRLALAAVTSARRSLAGRIGLVAVHVAAFAVFFAL